MTHKLKILPKYFEAVVDGSKTFEIRRNDRDYKVGDILILQEWSDTTFDYTGKQIEKRISYIFDGRGEYGLAKGYVILALKEV